MEQGGTHGMTTRSKVKDEHDNKDKDKIDITGQVAHGIFILPAKDALN